MIQILKEVGLIDARIMERFDCFRGTPKQQAADEFGAHGVNILAVKSGHGSL